MPELKPRRNMTQNKTRRKNRANVQTYAACLHNPEQNAAEEPG